MVGHAECVTDNRLGMHRILVSGSVLEKLTVTITQLQLRTQVLRLGHSGSRCFWLDIGNKIGDIELARIGLVSALARPHHLLPIRADYG